MTKHDLHPALRNLKSTLLLADLLSGRAPEWTVHLALARAPGVLSEEEARRALGIGGGL